MSTSKREDVGRTADLNQIIVKSPCPMDWEQMQGDDSVRYCEHCQKQVYDLQQLTRQQAGELLASQQEAGLCGRIARHEDGTVVTKDNKPKNRVRPFQFTVASLILLITSSAGLFASLPLVHRVVGPIVERWFAKPAANTAPPIMMGAFTVGEIEICPEDTSDIEIGFVEEISDYQ